MKIGIDARSIEGTRTGVGRILINILKEWAREPHEFVLYFKGEIPADEFLKSGNFTLKRLPPLLGRQSNLVFEQVLLPRALKRDKVDVFYAPSYTAPLFCPCPFVVVVHDISYEVFPSNVPILDKFARRFAGRQSAKKAAKVIAVSDFSRNEIIKHYGLASDKVIRVYQTGVEEELFSAKSDLAVDKPYSIFVGSFFNRRHIPDIIGAIKIINKSQPFSLILVGEDRTYPAQHILQLVKQANQEMGREAIIVYKNLTDADLGNLYRNASSVLLLSDYEGFGLPLLEGMALGTPVIIGPGSSLEEVSAGAALVSEPSNPERVARDILRLQNDKNLRESLVKKWKVRAQDFNWKAGAKEILNVITNVAENRN